MWADSSGPPTEPEEKGEASLTSPMRRYGEGERALLGAGGGTTVSQATFDMKGNCGYNLPHQELASYVPGGRPNLACCLFSLEILVQTQLCPFVYVLATFGPKLQR